MTDLEIEKRLAELLNVSWFLEPNTERNDTGNWIYSEHGHYAEMVELSKYTSDWGAMGPVISENRDIQKALSNEKFHWYMRKDALKCAALVAIKVLEARL